MVSEEQNQQRHKKTSLLELVRDPLFYKPIRVGCILMMIQQFSGIRKDFEIVHANKIINLKSEFRAQSNHNWKISKVPFNSIPPSCLSQLGWKIQNLEQLLLEF